MELLEEYRKTLSLKPDDLTSLVSGADEKLGETIEGLKESLGISKERAIKIILKERYNINSYEELKKEIDLIEKSFKRKIKEKKVKDSNLKIVK